MTECSIVFVEEKYNKYSIAALCGALEISSPIPLEQLDIIFTNAKQLQQSLNIASRKSQKVVIAYSFHTNNVINVANEVEQIRLCAQKKSFTPILLAGGPHPSGDPVGTIKMGFDMVMRNEGEFSFPYLLSCIVNECSLEEVPGLIYLDGEGLKRNKLAPRIDLNTYPPFSIYYKRFGPIEISRGCPWACHFCQTPSLMGAKMRHRSVDIITHYAEKARAQGLNHLRFVSPDSFSYGSIDGKTPCPEKLELLLRSVGDIYGNKKIFIGSFPSEVRPETVTSDTVQLVKRYAANSKVVLGAQSGSDRMLRLLHRGHTVEDVYKAVDLLLAANLIPVVDFIYALPGENHKDRFLTQEMMEKLASKGVVIHSHTFMPLPGTPLQTVIPQKVDHRTRRLLDRLASSQNQFGQWRTQEKQAMLTFKYLQKSSLTDIK